MSEQDGRTWGIENVTHKGKQAGRPEKVNKRPAVCRVMKVLLTGVGCPGAHALISDLYRHEPGIRIFGMDAKPYAIGRYLCDDFTVGPWATQEELGTEGAGSGGSGEVAMPQANPDFIAAIEKQTARWEADIIFPQTSAEMFVLSQAMDRDHHLNGIPVLASKHQWVALSHNKLEMYRWLEGKPGAKVPKYKLVTDYTALEDYARELGYPEAPVVIKPPASKGSRGVRTLTEDPKVLADQLFFNRPYARHISLAGLKDICDRVGGTIPPTMVMEFLPGEELKIDVIADGGRMLMGTVKHRLQFASGLAMGFTMLERENWLEVVQTEVLDHLPLSYCVDICYKGDHLMEINPRVSTFIFDDDYSMPLMSLKLALDQIGEDEVRAAQKLVKPGRKMFRWYGQQDLMA